MAFRPLEMRNIILGITASIAAYKGADLASKLTQAGAFVDTILSPDAQRFVTPLTFQSVTGREAYTDDDLWGARAHVLHVGMAHKADMLVIAPATANTIAKIAQGIADNLLTLTALAFMGSDTTTRILIAPAMDGGMYSNPVTQDNIKKLKDRGVYFVGPESGHLASGLVTVGRMSEPIEIAGHIRYLLTRSGPLKNTLVVITAGGTQEPIDPVRVITNRSSGKQGYALAQAALDRGAEVTLITTPTGLQPPIGANVIRVETAAEMEKSVLQISQQADALIMAAAVADFTPLEPATQKIKKDTNFNSIQLTRTEDILKELAKIRAVTNVPKVVVGFAAETEDLIENAMSKLQSKNLDLIVANNIALTESGFGVDTNLVSLIGRDGSVESLPLMSKTDVADQVMYRVINLLSQTMPE
jgi:phosphopantothenoylcysteine decarboxylase/phosphopantothenate--cysteine ligase